MRVVLDTNIVISAIVWGGLPLKLFEAAAAGTITLYTSPKLMEELRGVISRPHISKNLLKKGSLPSAAIFYYEKLVVLVSPLSTPIVVLGDPDDDHVVAAGVACTANLIVSGDSKHLLPLRSHDGIDIVTVRDALERLVA